MTTRRPRAARALLAGAAVLGAACGPEGPQSITEAAPASAVKFFNFGVNAPSVNFYANDIKITAANATSCTPLPAPPADSTCRSRGVESTNGTAFGSGAAGGFYVGLAPGQYTFTGRVTAATDNGLAIATVPLALAEGRNYSVYLTGFYNTAAKQSDAFVVEDPIPTALSGDSTYLRFVHAIPNAGPLVLFARTQTTPVVEFPVGAAVAYKGAGNFVAVPFRGSGQLDFVVRAAGSNATVASVTGVAIIGARVYTVAARGDATVTSTTAATRPQLTTTANR
jgi:hypothetical protein